jgi:hypothetical protein
MKEMVLTRLIDNGKQTIGMMTFMALYGKELFTILEPPWLNNLVNKSCIPPGDYICSVRRSEKYGKHLIVEDVPGRSDILFHHGNFRKNSKGCPLVGEKFRHIDEDNLIDITNSKNSMKRLMRYIENGDKINLKISDVYKVEK